MAAGPHHLSRKIEWALQQGRTQADLRRITGVKSRSAIPGWLRNGRIAKEHLPKLADATGTTPRWWLDPLSPIPPTPEWRVARVHQATAEFTGTATVAARPDAIDDQARELLLLWNDLFDEQKADLMARIREEHRRALRLLDEARRRSR